MLDIWVRRLEEDFMSTLNENEEKVLKNIKIDFLNKNHSSICLFVSNLIYKSLNYFLKEITKKLSPF